MADQSMLQALVAIQAQVAQLGTQVQRHMEQVVGRLDRLDSRLDVVERATAPMVPPQHERMDGDASVLVSAAQTVGAPCKPAASGEPAAVGTATRPSAALHHAAAEDEPGFHEAGMDLDDPRMINHAAAPAGGAAPAEVQHPASGELQHGRAGQPAPADRQGTRDVPPAAGFVGPLNHVQQPLRPGRRVQPERHEPAAAPAAAPAAREGAPQAALFDSLWKPGVDGYPLREHEDFVVAARPACSPGGCA